MQVILPATSLVQAKQTNEHFINNAISTKVGTDKEAFLSSWETYLTYTGSSTPNQITLPLIPNGKYNFTVQWGDGSQNNITTYNQSEVTHTYTIEGIYTVNITGLLVGWSFGKSTFTTNDAGKLLYIFQWGNIQLGNTGYYFNEAWSLNITAIDAPNLTGTSNMIHAFYGCRYLGHTGSMDTWTVSQVTDMNGMFEGAGSFNQSIGNWDVSNVTNMAFMFYDATNFNQPIGSWNVSQVSNMANMFASDGSYYQPTNTFNQSIGNWDVSHVTNMVNMFSRDPVFNQPIGMWNTSRVTDMSTMFYYASSFNQPIGSWNVSQVRDMTEMFQGDSVFNQSISNWNVSKVTDMVYMFYFDYLSLSIYDHILISWAKLPLQNNVRFYSNYAHYSLIAQPARQYLVIHFHWAIEDAGLLPTTPQPPLDLQILNGNHTINLTWTHPAKIYNPLPFTPPVSGYYVYRSENNDSGFVLIGTTTKLYFNDTGLTNNVTYYYKVQGFNNITFGFNSTVASGIPTNIVPTNMITSSNYQYSTSYNPTTISNNSNTISSIPGNLVILPILIITLISGLAFAFYSNKKINDSRK